MTQLKSLIWRYRYAKYLNVRGRLPWKQAWECSEDAWRDFGGDQDPIETAIGEMGYWSE